MSNNANDAAYITDAMSTSVFGPTEPSAPTAGHGGSSEASDAVVPEDEGGDVLYGDAVCITAYDPKQYSNEVIVTFGGKRDSKQWKPMPMPAAHFIDLLVKHKEGTKDGTSFVLGDMVAGQRLKTSVKALYGVGLDIDTGTPTEVVDAALQKLGCLAVRYSTHSSGKTKSEIRKDKVVKFAGDREIDSDLMYEYLTAVEQWDKSVVDTMEYLGTDHTTNGIMCQVVHTPMRKHRIVILFKDPFVIEDEAPTQAEAMKKWAKVPEALARLLEVPFDTSCTDPSRLFYLPRHAKGKPFGASLFGGPYFDWRTLQLDDPMEKLAAALTKGKGKSVTDEGRELGRWSLKRAHGFQIADVIDAHAPDRIRHNTGRGYEIECPFDEDHSNPGDTEDRACLVVNAGEGPSDFFTVSCRHETCRDKTNLDMLGKMLRDGWFEKTVLHDERFNAILEDEEKSETSTKPEKREKAQENYLAAIATLHPDSNDDEIDMVATMIVERDLSPRAMERAVAAMVEQLDSKVATVKLHLKQAQRKSKSTKPVKALSVSDKGHVTFTYIGDFNFDEACEVCREALCTQNKRDALPTYSQLNGKAVRLEIGEGRSEFIEMTQNAFWSELTKRVTFVKYNEDKGDGKRQQVNRDVAAHVYEQAYTTMPPAPEVLYTPVFLPDGALVVSEGYHYDPARPVNMLLLLNSLEVPPVPEAPSEKDMREALDWIETELLSDFPFCDVDSEGIERKEPSKAHALAMLLTPFMRRMINSPTPLFCINKPVPGTGGTLLAQLSITLSEGVDGEASSINYTANEDEMEKKLVSAVLETRSHLFFDDVEDFNNRVLLRALTAERIGGRVLGRSQNIAGKNNFNWIITGNNPNLGEEMRRRTCFINLDAKTADVRKRSYRHPDTSGLNFKEFVLTHRGLAIRHLLTLVEYWKAKGSPPFTQRRLSSFEDWGAKVGGVLEACGVEGFLDTPITVIPDAQKASEDEFLREMHKRFGTGTHQTVSALLRWADNAELGVVVTGRSPDEKQKRFVDKLQKLHRRTFKVGKDLFTLAAKIDEEAGVMYCIQNVETKN